MPRRIALLSMFSCAVVLPFLAACGERRLVGHDTDVLRFVADVPLPGGSSRFDYQSMDARNGRLYLSHMGAGQLVVFDTKVDRVVANVDGFPTVTGVLVVPELNRVFASAAGAHSLIAVDAGSLHTVGRVSDIRFPDGIAYDSKSGKLYVSDESGEADFAIDAKAVRRIVRIPLGGEAGNTQYDPVGNRIYVAVQTRNQMAAIDPSTNTVVARYDLPGSDHPHGFYIDAPRRLMFVSCEGNNKLLVVDMHTMKVQSTYDVGEGPDVLAFDPEWKRLYVASESGVVSIFDEQSGGLVKRGEVHAPNAHSVSVDPRTHRVYLPLRNVNGRPVLRILAATPPGR